MYIPTFPLVVLITKRTIFFINEKWGKLCISTIFFEYSAYIMKDQIKFLTLIILISFSFSCTSFDEESEIGPQCIKNSSGNGYTISGAVKDGMTGDNLTSKLILYSSEGMFCDNSTTTTSSSFSFSNLSSGNYNIKGLATNYSNINENIIVNDSYANQNIFTIKSASSINRIVIILSWGDKYSGAPEDIDAYLMSNLGTKIYYQNKNNNSNDNSSVWAYLDIDDTEFSGPETISVNTVDDKLKDNLTKLCFYTNIYSRVGSWSNSKAVVQLWKNGVLLKKYYAPNNSSNSNKWWSVFQLDRSLNITKGSGSLNSEITSC